VDFADQLVQAIREKRNSVLVGIDPRPDELPPGFLDRFPENRAGIAQAFQTFANEIIDVVAPLVPAVKFQAAFYEAFGPEGMAALHDSIDYAKQKGLLVILDGKRNDIGSTAEAYARAYLGRVPVGGAFEHSWQADALTVNPYLGTDGISPFVKIATRERKGVFVLVRTSNPSAGEFQDLVADGQPLYRHVARRLLKWADGHQGTSGYNVLGAVVGATYPEQLAELRTQLPGIIFLVPGYGTQGGTSQDIAPAFDENGLGAIVNNSRGITFAYERSAYKARFADRWQGAVEEAVKAMIADLAANTNAGKLAGG
jgi:orotidine-5'-phosphate decarboxylase